jgi:hypothetical protein
MSRTSEPSLVDDIADDDGAGLSGWLFADLLLALSVVFLAIVTTVGGGAADDSLAVGTESSLVEGEPGEPGRVTTTSTTTTTTTTEPETGVGDGLNVCPGIESPGEDMAHVMRIGMTDDELVREIDTFLNQRIGARLAAKGLESIDPQTIGVGYVLSYAGVNERTRPEEDRARGRAAAFVARMQRLMPERFIGSDSRPSFSNRPASEIQLLYFPRVPSVAENC